MVKFQKYSDAVLKRFEVCEDLEECLNQLEYDNRLAVAVSRQYAMRSQKRAAFYCFGESSSEISIHALTVLMKDGFKFVDDLNHFIKRAIEGGLDKKWLANSTSRYNHHTKKNHIVFITLNHLYGAFMLVIGGFLLAILVAIAEKIVYEHARKPNVSAFWCLAEMAIDPHRYFLVSDEYVIQ